MTPEQEQIVLDMLCKLRETKLISVRYYGSWMSECLLCDGEPSGLEDFFKHAHDCPIELAKRLHERRNVPNELPGIEQ